VNRRKTLKTFETFVLIMSQNSAPPYVRPSKKGQSVIKLYIFAKVNVHSFILNDKMFLQELLF
jgi:hypothetical protein